MSEPLSPREAEIVALVKKGLSNQDIARDLFLSVRTVEGHLDKASKKLGFRGGVRRAVATGLASAAAVTALGAAAMIGGAATQPPVPAAPVVLAAGDDNGDASAEAVAVLNSFIDPEGWAQIVGDGSAD